MTSGCGTSGASTSSHSRTRYRPTTPWRRNGSSAMNSSTASRVVNTAMANKPRFDAMRAFFEGVGADATAGVWEPARGVPQDRPEFREHYQRHLAKLARARKAEEMV